MAPSFFCHLALAYHRGLTDQSVALIGKKLTSRTGHEEDYSGHCLRAGFATQAAQSGVEECEIASTTRHLSPAIVEKFGNLPSIQPRMRSDRSRSERSVEEPKNRSRTVAV